ncbi:WD repeat-containing protein, putative [Babesia ovata]|uniref:WD repeat-containing protein, putative n=1 Tax=Babesia ovata TaxID=189622 RepID=A0A2H6KJ07_9APIC|nr:WD repeat-containing protein, putative [Babesia ovata]GBE62966.1 WD repeat-containing protein, putative [Babesia ovata]
MKHHVQAFLAVLRVIQSHGVAMEVAGVCCQSTAVAEHSELIVDTVVREARQPYEHLIYVARRPERTWKIEVTRLVVIVEMIEKNPERIFGVLIRVEDTFEIADEEHVTGERGAGVRTDVRVPQLGGEGTEPVRHAVYHSRAWPGEALRPEAGECLVKRVKQTTDLMAVALRTGYVGEQSAERRVNCTKSVSVVILGLGEQGTFFALTLPVLPPDLTAEILVDRGVESVERGGYDGNFSLFRDAFEAVKVSVRIFHEALVACVEIPVYLLRQLPQLLGHLGGEVFQRVLRGLHVVLTGLLAELRDCLFNLTVYEAFNVFYFLPFYVIGVGEELVAHGDGRLEVIYA